jgi:hypothetical protein
MSAPCPPPVHDDGAADEAGAPDAWERALLDGQLEALGRLAEMGMRLAGAIERRATEQAPGERPEAVLRHAAMDFSRVARAVRLTFAMQSKLVADFKKPSAGSAGTEDADDDAGPGEPYDPADDPDGHGPDLYSHLWTGDPPSYAQKRRWLVQRMVKRVAQHAKLGWERIERVDREARDRLEKDAVYGDVMSRSVGELIALICQDLGLQPDWAGFAGETWAQTEIAHQPPGSPFVGWSAAMAEPPPVHAASP